MASTFVQKFFSKELLPAWMFGYAFVCTFFFWVSYPIWRNVQRFFPLYVSALVMVVLLLVVPFVSYRYSKAWRDKTRRIRMLFWFLTMLAAIGIVSNILYRGLGGLQEMLIIISSVMLYFLLLVVFLHRAQRWKSRIQKLQYERKNLTLKEMILLPIDSSLAIIQETSGSRSWLYLTALFLLAATVFVVVLITIGGLGSYTLALIVLFGIGIPFFLLQSVMFAEVVQKKGVEIELRAAHDMQMGLMPTADPQIKGFDISGLCKPAEEVGGDYFDYVWLDEKKTKLGIAIADVSGKAMKAAMTAVMTSGMVYREIGSNETPKSILQKINKPLYLKMDRRMFTAMLFAVIDTKTRKLIFSNAGQMPPLLVRKGQVKQLKVDGVRLPLGIEEEVAYEEGKVQLKRGDLLVLYTDGIVEAMNEGVELYGFERLETAVGRGQRAEGARQMVEQLFSEVQTFSGSAKQHDDMTVVVIRVTS